jgi:hypothetical protein
MAATSVRRSAIAWALAAMTALAVGKREMD